MRFQWVLATAMAAGAMLTAAPASATVMIATMTGGSDAGYDYDGLFGRTGSLAYRAVTLVVTYDTALATPIVSGGETEFGGPFYGSGQSPILDAAVTIGGVTRTLVTDQRGYLSSTTGNWTYLQGEGATPGNFNSQFSALFYHDAPGDLEAPVSDWGDGYADISFYRPNDFGGTSAEVGFTIDHLEIAVSPDQPVAGVPEPAGWALLILGFGLGGAALRARRGTAFA